MSRKLSVKINTKNNSEAYLGKISLILEIMVSNANPERIINDQMNSRMNREGTLKREKTGRE
jgi:hypothetical protein